TTGSFLRTRAVHCVAAAFWKAAPLSESRLLAHALPAYDHSAAMLQPAQDPPGSESRVGDRFPAFREWSESVLATSRQFWDSRTAAAAKCGGKIPSRRQGL